MVRDQRRQRRELLREALPGESRVSLGSGGRGPGAAYLDLVALRRPHDQVVGDARRLEVPRHSQRQSVTSRLADAFPDHERPDGLLPEHLQRDLPARRR